MKSWALSSERGLQGVLLLDTAVAMRLLKTRLKHGSVLRKVKIFLTPNACACVQPKLC